jgi:MFS family permease
VSILVILLVGQGMASMDEEILVIAAPNLRQDLHASTAELQLVLAMYIVAFAALVVTGARLGDVIGRRRVFLLGLGGFTLASLAGGLAPTPLALIGARALQGASAAVMTPQVLSIIQLQFKGETRARAIGGYSMVLAAGVAAGQVLGGLLVSVTAAWRPALLLNAPMGAVLLPVAFRRLPDVRRAARRRFDLGGALLLSVALLGLVVPLSLGRDTGWPPWTWPCLVGCVVVFFAFIWREQFLGRRGQDPLFDLDVMRQPGIAAGVVAIAVLMACYAGFLVSLTLHLQSGLGFSPLVAGLTFTAYAAGFAVASLTWTRVRTTLRDRFPIAGSLTMGVTLLGVGLVAAGGGWPAAITTPLLFCAGAGNACAFSPLASGLTSIVDAGQGAEVSGLIITASLVGQVLGVAAFVDVYFAGLPHGSSYALALTTGVLAAALVPAAVFAGTVSAPGEHAEAAPPTTSAPPSSRRRWRRPGSPCGTTRRGRRR